MARFKFIYIFYSFLETGINQALLQGRFPDMGYRFILAWCFMTIFDPILILIVDVILHRWRYVTTEPIGDAFKLYWHFEQTDNGGLPGVFVTIFIYIVIMFSSKLSSKSFRDFIVLPPPLYPSRSSIYYLFTWYCVLSVPALF